MQKPIYTAEEEQLLMSQLWSPRLANDPLAYVMFVFPWGQPGTPLEHFKGPRQWQRRILKQMGEHITKGNTDKAYKLFRKAVASGRGIGKSALVSWLIVWFLTTRLGSSVIVSANTETQLRTITWAELSKWVAMAINSHWWEISGITMNPAKWLKELVERDLKKGTGYWGATGKLWSEENPDAYAGPHNHDGMMVIFDEASGIPSTIWGVANGYFTEPTPNRFWFAFSQGRRNSGYFFECFNAKREFWDTDKIDARTVEGTDKNLYQEIIDEYGEDSNEASVEVYGDFPSDDSDSTVIKRAWVDQARTRDLYKDETTALSIGCDIARFGKDKSAAVVREGRNIHHIEEWQGHELDETAGRLIHIGEEWEKRLKGTERLYFFVDSIGVGAGIVPMIRKYIKDKKKNNWSVIEVVVSNKSPDIKCKRLRDALWWKVRKWFQDSLPAINSNIDKKTADKLCTELASPNYRIPYGEIVVESKDDMKARGIASPNLADGLIMTFALNAAKPRQKNKDDVWYEKARKRARSEGSWMTN